MITLALDTEPAVVTAVQSGRVFTEICSQPLWLVDTGCQDDRIQSHAGARSLNASV